MRRSVLVVLVLAACGGSSPPPTAAPAPTPAPVVAPAPARSPAPAPAPAPPPVPYDRTVDHMIEDDDGVARCFGGMGEGVSAEVVASVTIGADGVPLDVTTDGHPRFRDCVAAAVKAMKFPAPPDGVVRIRYPIRRST